MGTLYLVSTPIGNLEDISIRAIKTLLTVDVVACEDTRRTGLLIAELKKRYASVLQIGNIQTAKLFRYDIRNERIINSEILEMLKINKNIALVSDAGTPLINDPGYNLIQGAIDKNISINVIPGASAFLTALIGSGLPTEKLLFAGYPPEKQSHRKLFFEELLSCFRTSKHNHPTIIFYCAPHKMRQTIKDMFEVFGDIQLVISRELTKVHEEVWRGTTSEALNYFSIPKGEIVLLFRLGVRDFSNDSNILPE